MKTWTEGQAAAFLEAVADDRLSAAWQLSLYGLRRGEVLGLCWSDVDLQAKTLIIRRARVEVTGSGGVEVGPKTERGKRTLPLDDALASALRSLKARQARERLEAGEAYAPSRGECSEAHIVVDELGWPVRPEWHSNQFRNLAKAAGLPAIRLHDARHTCGTLMHLRGVPTAVISKWLGHATASFTMATYVPSRTMLWQKRGPCTPRRSGPLRAVCETNVKIWPIQGAKRATAQLENTAVTRRNKGADGETRTPNLLFTRQLRYLLRHASDAGSAYPTYVSSSCECAGLMTQAGT
jgi:Phage integrase family